MSNTAETTLKALPAATAELSKKLDAAVVFSGEGENLKAALAEDSFTANMPEGITPELDKAVQNYRSNFRAAGVHSLGMASVKKMTDDKSVKTVEGTIAMGAEGTTTVLVERSHAYTNRMGDKPTEVIKYGQTTVAIQLNDTPKTGQLNLARRHIGAAAAEAFGKK
jgi:hypothetical protein